MPFSLLETMRMDEGRVVRLERHLARLASSARHFHYVVDEARIRAAIASTANAHSTGSFRARLLVAPDGTPTIDCTPYLGDGKTWRVAFAETPVNHLDEFLSNKTTHRQVYESARRQRMDVDDVILWNERGEVTESTIANVVAKIDGVRYTPPLSCGLLAGTFRAELLDAGLIDERLLTRDDVTRASRLWLVNSVREWVDAVLV